MGSRVKDHRDKVPSSSCLVKEAIIPFSFLSFFLFFISKQPRDSLNFSFPLPSSFPTLFSHILIFTLGQNVLFSLKLNKVFSPLATLHPIFLRTDRQRLPFILWCLAMIWSLPISPEYLGYSPTPLCPSQAIPKKHQLQFFSIVMWLRR